MSNNKYYILYDTKYIEGDIYGGPIFLTNDFKTHWKFFLARKFK